MAAAGVLIACAVVPTVIAGIGYRAMQHKKSERAPQRAQLAENAAPPPRKKPATVTTRLAAPPSLSQASFIDDSLYSRDPSAMGALDKPLEFIGQHTDQSGRTFNAYQNAPPPPTGDYAHLGGARQLARLESDPHPVRQPRREMLPAFSDMQGVAQRYDGGEVPDRVRSTMNEMGAHRTFREGGMNDVPPGRREEGFDRTPHAVGAGYEGYVPTDANRSLQRLAVDRYAMRPVGGIEQTGWSGPAGARTDASMSSVGHISTIRSDVSRPLARTAAATRAVGSAHHARTGVAQTANREQRNVPPAAHRAAGGRTAARRTRRDPKRNAFGAPVAPSVVATAEAPAGQGHATRRKYDGSGPASRPDAVVDTRGGDRLDPAPRGSKRKLHPFAGRVVPTTDATPSTRRPRTHRARRADARRGDARTDMDMARGMDQAGPPQRRARLAPNRSTFSLPSKTEAPVSRPGMPGKAHPVRRADAARDERGGAPGGGQEQAGRPGAVHPVRHAESMGMPRVGAAADLESQMAARGMGRDGTIDDRREHLGDNARADPTAEVSASRPRATVNRTGGATSLDHHLPGGVPENATGRTGGAHHNSGGRKRQAFHDLPQRGALRPSNDEPELAFTLKAEQRLALPMAADVPPAATERLAAEMTSRRE